MFLWFAVFPMKTINALFEHGSMSWWLKKRHFQFLFANIDALLESLTTSLGDAWRQAWTPGPVRMKVSSQFCKICQLNNISQKTVAIDETVIPFRGSCPVSRFIPRKPNGKQHGMLVYLLSSYSELAEVPFLLDLVPILPGLC